MGNRVDDIVRALSDEGQRSTEQGHPEDRGVVPDGVCWRCVSRPVVSGHDLCSPCRSFLLGDTEVDPIGVSLAAVHSDEDVLLGQSSFIAGLFDETAHELVPYRGPDIMAELHGGLSDGETRRVHAARDGGPPNELFTPVGMDHGVMRTERYVLDRSSGPEHWVYEIDEAADF